MAKGLVKDMKRTFVGSVVLAFGAALAACGGAVGDPSPTSGSSSEGQTAETPLATDTSTAVQPICTAGHRLCKVRDKRGTCREECVPDNVLCIAPTSCERIVCDPPGPAPRVGCSWDEKTCKWDCPVCDPPGPAPRVGCSW